MKTLVVFCNYLDLPVFYVLDGDKRHWNGVTVNAGPSEATADEWELKPDSLYADA